MTTLLLDVGRCLLAGPLAVSAPEVLDLVVAEPCVVAAEIVLDGRVVARSGKPGEAATLALPLDGAGELLVWHDGALDAGPYAVIAHLLSLAARTETAVAEERHRIADTLHDGLVQTLVAARMIPSDDILCGAVAEARDLMRELRGRPAAATVAEPGAAA